MKIESVFGDSIETNTITDIAYTCHKRIYKHIPFLVYYRVNLYFSNDHTYSINMGFRKKDFILLVTEICEKMINGNLTPKANTFKVLKLAYEETRCFKFKKLYNSLYNKLDDSRKLLLEIE